MSNEMLQIIALVAYLVQERRPAGPFMVVAPSSLIANWEQEFQQWAPSLKLVSYKGTADARAALFTQQVGLHFNCDTTVNSWMGLWSIRHCWAGD